jgi:hypothetical protein
LRAHQLAALSAVQTGVSQYFCVDQATHPIWCSVNRDTSGFQTLHGIGLVIAGHRQAPGTHSSQARVDKDAQLSLRVSHLTLHPIPYTHQAKDQASSSEEK